MITATLATVLLSGSDQASPVQILSEMIGKYHYAAHLSGTIETTMKAGGQSEKIVTTLQFSSPNKIYINQVLASNPRLNIMAIADGVKFVYPKPSEVDEKTFSSGYLSEPIEQRGGGLLNVRSMYSILTAMLPDRSIPLDILMGRPVDLENVNLVLSDFEDGGTREYNGETVSVIFCRVKRTKDLPPTLKGVFFINGAYDLRYFKVYERAQDATGRILDFEMEYNVNARIGDSSVVNKELYDLKRIKG